MPHRYWSAIVEVLDPYVPGEQPKISDLIKLNTNENPYGPSPRVLEAIRKATTDALRLYPDPQGNPLREKIADYYHLTPDHVFLGNGSDEVLAFSFQAFFQKKRPILFPDITYSFYPSYCRLYQIPYALVPLRPDFTLCTDDFQRENGGIIFPNPNAPTGILLSLADIARLLDQHPDQVVVIDEAYIDFGGKSAIALIQDHPNLLVTQTFSKSRALAGLRVGFAVGHPTLIEGMVRVKDSFNSYPLDRLAIVGACAALEDAAYFERARQSVIDSRAQLTLGLQGLGFEVLPSSANFVLTQHQKHDAVALAAHLRAQKILVRHFSQHRIAQFLRITVGTLEQNAALLAALSNL